MKRRLSRALSIILFAAMLLQTLGLTAVATAQQPSNPQVTAAQENGLPANTKDGVIFHAWNWSFDSIKNNMAAIAAAGYKSIQTSPIQANKEALTEGSKWWVLYQPINFKIGNTQLGNRDQFKAMCDEAERYGISIIVDVIANHTGNAGGGNLEVQPAQNVDPAIKNNPNFWHQARKVEDWNNRWQVTQWGIGLPDLNTSNQELQNMIIAFLNDAIALGADGFRFDAAKHIELPDDGDGAGSNFWPRVLGALDNKENLYIYGEVLQGGADRFASYANYMNLAADSYGHAIRDAVGFSGSKNVDTAKFYNAANVSPSKLVTWVESHDTYANDSNESTNMNEWQIKMGWSIIASRAETTSLFFNRPGGSGKFGSPLGQPGNNLWKDPDVVAVNKFHNAMVGQGEYLRTQGNQIMLVERGTKGITIVNLGGDAGINSETRLANGTYTNQATGGGTFTVSNGRITGNIGAGKIAVLYEAAAPVPAISIDKQEGSFYTDVLDVKVTYTGSTSATYTLNNGTATPINSGGTVSFGAGAAFGTPFVLKITSSNSAGQTAKTYTFTKVDPNAALSVHFYKPAGWGTPNIYYYDESVTPTKIGAQWPGVAMTDSGNGWYSYQIPGWQKAQVIFNSGSNQVPGASQPGYQITGQKWIKNNVVHSANPDVPSDQPPTVPTNVQGTAAGTTAINLTWTASTDDKGVVKYEIYRDGTLKGEATGTTYTDTAVAIDNTYSYTVLAVDTIGQKSPASGPAVVRVGNGGQQQPEGSPFSWDNVNVYFVMTDRFYNGNTSNDGAYGRPKTDAWGSNIGTFHGGDIKGLTKKLEEDYFTDLGTNAIWITAPWEQMHGWVGGKDGDFAHYGYHGYYGLDFTAMDKSMGTIDEMREFVDLAHSKGIRVVLDVVMNHVAYPTLVDMAEYNYGDRGGLAGNWTPNQNSGQNWHTHNNIMNTNNASAWASWWGSSWIRANNIAGYDQCGGSDLTLCVGFLPDIKTESTSGTTLPPILKTKFNKETSGYDQWIVPAAKQYRKDLNVAPKDYMIKWLSSWVEEFGIDGFRIDTAKHVSADKWKELKTSASSALAIWRQNNPTKPGADWNDGFWMTGEVWGQGLGRDANYFNNGFDSLINFSFQSANMSDLEGLFSRYASEFNNDLPNYNMLSYLSSHDKGLYNRGSLMQAGTALLLLPGGIQTYYGDESGRPFGPTGSDADQGTRSDMNWGSMNQNLLSHWQKLGQFRNNHIAVGAGEHKKIADSPYTFSRSYEQGDILDKVVVAVGASGTVAVNVGSVFPDGTTVRDAYTQNETVVSGGKATFVSGTNGVILIENVGVNKKFPILTASPAGGKFNTETTTVTLSVKNADSGKYTLDGSDPANGTVFTNGTTITIGGAMAIDETKTLRMYAANENGEGTGSFTFTKGDPNAKLDIYFKKPAGWGTPAIYFYETAPKEANEPTWATAPAMTDVGDGWYVYSFQTAEEAKIIFKDNTGKQLPGQSQPGFIRAAPGWYDGSTWHDEDPRQGTKPAAPTNLASSAKTDATVNLTWTASASAGISGYDVYRNNAKVGTTAATNYTDTGLTAATAYTYKVMARSQAGSLSDPSNEIVVTTEPRSTNGNTVTVYYKKGYATPYIHYRPEGGTWTAVPGVKMDESEIPGYAKYTIDLGTSTATRVEAAFNNGSGQWDSNNQRNYFFNKGDNTYEAGVVKPGKPVYVPGNKVTVYYKEGWTNVNIHYRPEGGTWTAVPGVKMENDPLNPGYKKMTIDIGTATRLEACFNNGSNVWDSNGQQNYFFNVGDNTYLPGNNGVAGQVKAGERPEGTDTIAPSVPANLGGNLSTGTPKTVTLSWGASTDNIGVTGYEITRKEGTNTETFAVNGTTFIDSTVAGGRTYKYQVRAKDAKLNFSGYSNEVTIAVPSNVDTLAPSAPTNLTGAAATTSVALTWTASADNVGVAGYDIIRNGAKVGTSATTSFTDTGLTEETTYSYAVKAFDAANNFSAESAAMSVRTLKGTVVIPGGNKPYSTNPTFGKRVSTPITIDGVNGGQWTDDMLIAIDMAGDDPRTLGSNWSLHETPMDLTHLWAAWDDDYLYLAWQYVDVTDVIDPANAGSAGGTPIRSMDMPQTIAIDTIAGAGATLDMWGKNGGKPIWGGADLPDYQFNIASNMFHSGYISKAVNGVFPVDDGGVNYKTGAAAGITVKFAKGAGYNTLWGVKDADDAGDASKLVDFMTLGHDVNRDTFYEAKIPLSAIGNPDIQNAGIGVKLHQGEFSPMDTLPHDPATIDTPGVSESNSPKEWSDIDLLTTPFARIGK